MDAFLNGHFEMLGSPTLIAELTDVLGREKFAAHAAEAAAPKWSRTQPPPVLSRRPMWTMITWLPLLKLKGSMRSCLVIGIYWT